MDPFARQDNESERAAGQSCWIPGLLSALIWGLGQLYNGQFKKAGVLFLGQLVFLLYHWDYWTHYVVYQTLSPYLGHMGYSIGLSVFSLFGAYLWYFSAMDAWKTAEFFEMVAYREYIEGMGDDEWDLGDMAEEKKTFPWGSVFVYAFLLSGIAKYVLSGSHSEYQRLIEASFQDPSNLNKRLALVHHHLSNQRRKHALAELEDFQSRYGTGLSQEDRQKLDTLLSKLREKEIQKSFVVEQIIEQPKNKPVNWEELYESQSWELFYKNGVNYLENEKTDAVLVRLLLQGLIKVENWSKVKEYATQGLRVDPHEPYFLSALATAENHLFEAEQSLKNDLVRKKAFVDAVNRFQSGEYEQSLSRLGEYFSAGGREHEAYLLKNSILFKQENYQASISNLNSALKVYPSDSRFLEALGKAYFKTGDYLLAINAFTELARSKPDKTVYKNIGICYKRLGKYGEAREFYQKGLERDPSDETLMFLLAYASLKDGRAQEAITLYKKIEQQKPTYPLLHYYMGQAYEKHNDSAAAVRSYQRVKSSSPVYQKAMERINVLIKTLAANPALKKNPAPTVEESRIDKVAKLLEAAEHAFQGEEWELSLNYYKKVLEVEPAHFRAMSQIGRIYFESEGNYAQAEIYLLKALQLKPDSIWVNLALGVIAKSKNETEKAMDYFRRALMIEPQNLNANFNMALIYEDLNQLEKAKDYYLVVIANHPRHQLAYNYLGDIYFNEGDYFKAQEMYREILKLSPENAGIRFKLALCLERVQDFTEAKNQLETLLKLVSGEEYMQREVETALQRVQSKLMP